MATYKDMQRVKIILLILIANLGACVEQEIQQVEIAQSPVVADCVFNNLQTAPGWICDEAVYGLEIQAVGMVEKSAAGQNYMQDMARIAALKQLAEKLKGIAEKRVRQYIAVTGGARTETLDAVADSVVKTITRHTLENTKNYNSLIGPEGRIYVLVGLDKITAQVLLRKAVRMSIKNEQALWQMLEIQKSDDEIVAGIAATKE